MYIVIKLINLFALSAFSAIFADEIMTYSDLWHRLLPLYEPSEAQSIVRWLLDMSFGMSLTDIVCGKVSELSRDDAVRLEKMMVRLESGEPVQYVAGVTEFCGRLFGVAPGVLIPRPETAEMCQRIVAEWSRPYCCLQPPAPLRVLDIGTGSGCIAVTLAQSLSPVEVTAWDISPDALLVARDNARRLGAKVHFECRDALQAPLSAAHADAVEPWDLIVSNPPYIAEKERAAMRPNVLDHEPSLALFVPDDDPLRFYRAIARYARQTLRPGGQLWFEINPVYAADLMQMLADMGFADSSLEEDAFGRKRFAKAAAR